MPVLCGQFTAWALVDTTEDTLRSNMCWRGCGTQGTFLHCWWECPKVQLFWMDVRSQLTLIIGRPITLQPDLVLLNYWAASTAALTMEFLDLCFAAAHHVIALHWKSSAALLTEDWYTKLWDFFLQDKISTSILYLENRPVPKNFQEKWQPLLDAASKRRIDTTLFSSYAHHDLLSHF